MLLDKISHFPKPIIFGILGAAGAFTAALLGELLPLSEHQGSSANAPRSVINFSTETQRRLDREGAEEGEIELALSWGNKNDLDLHCISADQEHVYFQEKRCQSGGFLDVDMNVNIASASESPIEHIRWKEGTAPIGEYEVYVHHYTRHIDGSDPTKYKVEMKWGSQVKIAEGTITHAGNEHSTANLSDAELVHTFTYDPSNPTSSAVLILLVGLWAGLLAIGTGIGLVIGQNSMLRRPLLTVQEAGLIIGFGLLAGLASGAFGQTAYRVVSGIGSLRWIGQVGGWMVLGGLLAMGISIFVPNMKPMRGLAGGVAGGGIGSLAFLFVGLILGNAPARVIGAALLGLCIGAVIALVDAFFREAWVEIHYGPNEMRTVALGRKPITIGSHREFCTVMAKGTPDVALRYTLLDGKISCEDVPAGRTVDVQPGDRRTAGNLQVVVCAAQPTTPPAESGNHTRRTVSPAEEPVILLPKSGYQLRVRGRRFPLNVAARLGSSELAGLETTEPDGAVAEVTAHPRDPTQLGLKNLSIHPWKATMPDGNTNEVPTGKNVRLVTGVQIDFGVLKGSIE